MTIPRVQQYLAKFLGIAFNLIILIAVLRFFIAGPTVVFGPSMEPTLINGTRLMINKVSYLLHPPERFDIVQFYDQRGSRNLIKRVIALPGETVTVQQNHVFIKNALGQEWQLDEPYLPQETVTEVSADAAQIFIVPKESYFLLGDNRTHSSDSRVIGPVHRSFIIGKLLFSLD